MMHPRTIIRNAIGAALVENNGAYKSRVYLQRDAKLDSNSLPAICVFTHDERTKEQKNTGVYYQELSCEIQIYVKRIADQLNPHESRLGAPSQAVQFASTADALDDICVDVENTIVSLVSKMVTYLGESVCIENVPDINTKLDQSADGDTPHLFASITFNLEYTRNMNVEKTYCGLENYLSNITVKGCNE